MTVTQTPRLGLNKWGSTSDAWTITQQNADADAAELLTAIYSQGTLGARPAAAKAGRFYWATDQLAGGKLSYDNGSAWELVPHAAGGAGSTQALGDAAAAGTANTWSRSDHKHAMPAWATSAVDLTSAAGTAGSATDVARGDHRHGLPATTAYTDAATVNFTGDLQAGGQSVSRGLVGIDTAATPGTSTNGNEVMYTPLQSTFTVVSGHAYLIVFTFAFALSSGADDSFFLRLRDGTTTGGAQIDVWILYGRAIFGTSDSRTVYWKPAGAGSHTISPSYQKVSAGGVTGAMQSGQLAIIDIGT